MTAVKNRRRRRPQGGLLAGRTCEHGKLFWLEPGGLPGYNDAAALGNREMADSQYKLYDELAAWWPLLSPPDEYDLDAECVWSLLMERRDTPPMTVLELGSGGGNTASHLKMRANLTLVDRSEGMLRVSRALNPECEHLVGDMRTVRLGRLFDAVYIHDAIMYMTTEEDLRAAIRTAVFHCRPGGVAAFLPDCTLETFRENSEHGGHDGDGRGLRYLQWDIDPDPSDTAYTVHFAYLLRDCDGAVRAEFEQHRLGRFPRDTWLGLIREAGCEVHTAIGPGGNEVFAGIRRTDRARSA